MDFLTNIKIGASVVMVTLASLFGFVPAKDVQSPILGSTYATPEVRALFSTTLASKITPSATSMTLTSATDKDGNTLASSTYGFIIDEGTSVEEFVLADCTGTACTNMTRGLSISTGTTTVAALQFEHRRGASVKITDAPSLIFAMNVFKGKQNIENKLRYNSAQTFTNATDIISKDYADSLSFGAVPEATETAAGFGEVATGLETASSTSSGTEARLLIPASLATSTYNSATAGLKVVVTQNDGKIDNNFIATSTLFNNISLASSTSFVGGIPLLSIGKNIVVLSSVGTSTFSVPSGNSKIVVQIVGGGGSADYGNSGTPLGSNGGGSGAYSLKMVDVTGTSTIQYHVGNAEEYTSFGTPGTSIYFSVGAGGHGSTAAIGSAGTVLVNGDLNIGGAPGGRYNLRGDGSGSTFSYDGGSGAASIFGGGGYGGNPSGSDAASASAYGAGGGGGGAQSGANTNGGNGKQGVIIITW